MINKPNSVVKILAYSIALLLVLHLASLILYRQDKIDYESFELFNFNQEKNIPSIFSSLLFVYVSILLFYISQIRLSIAKQTNFWFGLGIIFLFLAFDELLRLHEGISRSVEKKINVGGFFYYEWVIPYGIALFVLAIFIIRPFFNLPKKYQKKFLVAGVIFISAAMGLEMITGAYIDGATISNKDLESNTIIVTLYTVEELLEMIGLSLFIISLYQFINQYKTTPKPI